MDRYTKFKPITYSPILEIKRHRNRYEYLESIATLSLDILSFSNPTLFSINLAVKCFLILLHFAGFMQTPKQAEESKKKFKNDYHIIKSKYGALRGVLTLPALYIAVINQAQFLNPMALYFGFRVLVGLTAKVYEIYDVAHAERYMPAV
jgi:hypothetical protein